MAKIENKNVQTAQGDLAFAAKPTGKTLRIGYFVQPLPTEEAYKELVECGINTSILIGDPAYEAHKKELDLGAQFGLPVFVGIPKTIDKAFELTQYKQHPAFAGFMLDEPVVDANTINGCRGIKEMGERIEEFEQVFEGKPFIINLNPARTYWVFREKYTYDEYVEVLFQYFLNKTHKMEKWLSADDYPLYYDPKREKDQLFLYEGWLRQLELMAHKKNKYPGVKTHLFIQSIPYLPEHVREIFEEDLRMQMYACLAFDFDWVSYFTYMTPSINVEFNEETLGLVDRDGKKTKLWYGAKNVNAEMKKLEKVYCAFPKFAGALTIVGENNKKVAGYENPSLSLASPVAVSELGELKHVVPSEDLLVSRLRNDEDRDLYVLVNYNDTSKRLTNSVNLSFAKAKSAYVCVGGECKKVQLEDGKLRITLDVGEGVFVIPELQ